MPDPSTLPTRLRHAALMHEQDGHSAQDDAIAETLRQAADEIERARNPILTLARAGEVHVGGRLDSLVADANHRFVATVETMEVADGVLTLATPDARREAAYDLPVRPDAIPEHAEPTLRRLVVANADPLPSLGAIVRTEPTGALWRLHDLESTTNGTFVAVVEPVDPHDVPVTARVTDLPAPLREDVPA